MAEKWILVVPTNRPGRAREFFGAWRESGAADWHDAIVVEDGPEQTFDVGAAEHHSWATIRRHLGRDAAIISRRDSAIRCFGFWRAWKLGATMVVTLDDDVRPHGAGGICGGHRASMADHPRWVSTVPGLRVRGLPYRNLGHLTGVVASVGLWSGVPDLDGATQLASPVADFEPPPGRRVVPEGQYAPMCGMNLAVRREALPLCYFPLMGEGYPYSRFDDIWFGVVFKRICDHLGWRVSVGEPFVRHDQASDPRVNAAREAPGVEANEAFWVAVDSAPLSGDDPAHCLEQLGEHFRRIAAPADYVRTLGEAVVIWSRLFR